MSKLVRDAGLLALSAKPPRRHVFRARLEIQLTFSADDTLVNAEAGAAYLRACKAGLSWELLDYFSCHNRRPERAVLFEMPAHGESVIDDLLGQLTRALPSLFGEECDWALLDAGLYGCIINFPDDVDLDELIDMIDRQLRPRNVYPGRLKMQGRSLGANNPQSGRTRRDAAIRPLQSRQSTPEAP